MNEKVSTEAEKPALNKGAVMCRFLFVIYFIAVSLIIGALLPITPFYFIATGKNWIELLVKKANYYSDMLF